MIRRSLLSAPVRLTALLLVLVFVATGCHRGDKKKDADEGAPVEQLYEKSHKLMEGGNWSGAATSFKRLIAQYHPDRVVNAAPELREQAERRARELNRAYDRIKTLRKNRK